MFNQITLIGRVGRDGATAVETKRGYKITFSMATWTYSYKDGERKEYTEWHQIIWWGDVTTKRAKILLDFQKGDLVLVVGMKKTHKWTDKEGHTNYNVQIDVSDFGSKFTRMIGSDYEVRNPFKGGKAAEPEPESGGEMPFSDDDVPF